MAPEYSRLDSRALRRPIHSPIWHFALAGFIGALATDITYWQTAEMMWANFSAWLLFAGLVLGLLAIVLLLVDLLTRRLIGINRVTWPYLLGNALTLILAVFNSLIHSRDAYTSVVPTGLMLSACTVVVIFIFGLATRVTVYRRAIGVIVQ